MDAQLYRYTEAAGWWPSLDSSLDGEGTLVLCFSDLPDGRVEIPLEKLKTAFPRAILAGCSTAGQIHQQHYYEQGASAAVIRFHRSRLQLSLVNLSDHEDCRAAGEALAKSLDAPDLAGVLVLSEGLEVNGSALMAGVNQVFGGKVPVTGGLAADGTRFRRTWVLGAGERAPGHVCAVGFHGDSLEVGHGSFGGWDMLGPERLVTRSEGNRLFELDGQPALALYKKYLGEMAAELPASGLLFPLALRRQEEDQEPTVRTILAVDEASQSITFAGDIPQDNYVQLMYANFDRLVQGAGRVLEGFDATEVGERPLVCLAVSCVGRRLILGQRIEEEIEALSERLPAQTRLFGFYSYGELSPLASGHCDLHNQTMTVTLWWER